MITYEHMMSQKNTNEMTDELWEYELNFISHADLVELARLRFVTTLENLSHETLIKHYEDTIG